jgi:hypothetical protein
MLHCSQRGEGGRKGVPHPTWQPIPVPSSQMGEVVSCHADLFPCPVGGQTRGPCLHMNRGRPKGCWGVPCSLSCARQGGSGQREGGVPFAQRLASPICAQRWGGTNPVHGGWCQQGTSGGVHRRAMWHQGGGGRGYVCTPCVCVFLQRGEVTASRWK